MINRNPVQLRHIDPALWSEIKLEAMRLSIPVHVYLGQLLRKHIERRKQAQVRKQKETAA